MLSALVVPMFSLCLGPAAAWAAERLIECLAARLDRRAIPYLLADSGVHGIVAAAVWGAGIAWAGAAGRTGTLRRLLRFYAASLPCQLPQSPWACSLWVACGWAVGSVVACAVLACLLDLDHFVAAAWWNSGRSTLSAAMHLPSRPFGHAVAFVAASVALSAVAAPRSPTWLIIAVAWGTHLMRDALRRGLWLWPFASTPPVPMPLYLAALAAAGVGVGAVLLLLCEGAVPGATRLDGAEAIEGAGDLLV